MQVWIGYIMLSIDTYFFLDLVSILEFKNRQIKCCNLEIKETIVLTTAVTVSLQFWDSVHCIQRW